jgi:hypothetical protein
MTIAKLIKYADYKLLRLTGMPKDEAVFVMILGYLDLQSLDVDVHNN